MRRVLVCVVALLALGTSTACSALPVVACPAIGWFNTVKVTIAGPMQDVNLVQLCVRGVCSVTGSGQAPEPHDGSSAPTARAVPPTGLKTGDRSWTFSLPMTKPQ